MNIINLSLKNRVTIYVLILALVVGGALSYKSLPLESFPEVQIPILIINTFYFGVSPEDIESLVTDRIERELKGIDGVKEIKSVSMEGLSSITIEFMPNIDIDVARQKVRDRIDIAKPNIPEDAEDPVIMEINLDEFPIMYVALTGENIGLYNLKRIADNFSDKIRTVPGVLGVDVSGGLEREIQVNVIPERLKYYGVSLGDIINKIKMENITLPGGSIEIGSYNYSIRIPGEIKTPDAMFDWIITEVNNRPIYLRDLSEIQYKYKEIKSISRLNGKEAITLGVKKRTGENVVNIADEVKRMIETEKMIYNNNINYTVLQDHSKYIRDMVDDLENNIITSLILVVAILFLALGLKNSIVIAIAIPLSMLISFAVLSLLGITLNMIVLFSLILALGMLVDNGIVLVENIYRHKQLGENNFNAALRGASEIAIPITTSTLTTVSAFAPLLFWPGIIGEFMSYLPKTVIIVLLSSLFVAIVITPVISSMFATKIKPIKNKKNGGNRFLKFYRKLLLWSLCHKWLVVFFMIIFFIITIVAFGMSNPRVIFFPATDPQTITIDIEFPESSVIDKTNNYARYIENILDNTIDVDNYVTNVGQEGRESTHKAHLSIDFFDMLDRKQSSVLTLNQIRDSVQLVPNVKVNIMQQEDGPPTGAAVAVEISGEDFNKLREYRNIVKQSIEDIPGLINLRDDFVEAKSEIQVMVDRELASRYDLSMFSISQNIQAAMMGISASKYRVGEDEYDITVRYKDTQRNNFNDLRDLIIFGPKECQIPLANLATFDIKPGFGTINHKDLKRMITVEADVREGYNANNIRNDVITRISEIEFEPGYLYDMAGEGAEQDEAGAFLTNAFIGAVFLITLILVTQFNSIILPFIIIFSVFLSTMGVLWGLMITGFDFSVIMTGIGIISLAGIVVNNAIVLIDFIEQARKSGMSKVQAILKAGRIRMRPVLLTATTTTLALIPMAVGISYNFKTFEFITGSENAQWWGPMCVAVIFGLIIATVLTLIVVPVLYHILDGWRIFKKKY